MPITPDTKDWTWVLERTCPECGFDVWSFAREEVGSLIRSIADSWREVLTLPGVGHRPSEDVWSPLEYGCHVRDVFHLYDERLEMMLQEENPLFPNWDQDETAVAQRYEAQDPVQVREEIVGAARPLAARFDGVSDAQWDRPGRRSDGATFTIETFARYLVHDPIHHLKDVAYVHRGDG